MPNTKVPLGNQPITEQGMTPNTSQSMTPAIGQSMTPVTNGNNTITTVDPSSISNIQNIDPSIMDSFGKKPPVDTGKQNLYNDVINANKEKPQYTGSGGDRSSGAAAASGTQYSWDKQGMDAAQNQYQQDALAAKQSALNNRQTIEQNALQYQQQADMMQYTSNQEAEKVGWTGGYVLDQNRQMEYLKSSIQAQMYGAMELQKYGYDSALAAARLSYDLNQKEFAHKYYQEAVNTAITEAQITGTYFSAETRDMMSQYNVAMQELKGIKISDMSGIDLLALTPEQKRAFEVIKNIDSWYAANRVSKTGVQTLAAWETEQSMVQQWADAQWSKYQAAMQAVDNKLAEDSNAFIMLDKEGNPIYDGLSVQVGNFRTMTAEEIIDYVNNTSAEGKQQVYGYIDGTFEKTIVDYLATTKSTKDENGNITYTIDKTELENALKNNDKINGLEELLPGYEYSTKAGESLVRIKVDDKGNLEVVVSESASTEKKQDIEEVKQTVVTNEKIPTSIKENYNKLIDDTDNHGINITEASVNQAGDKFSNDDGNREPGNNFSIKINGEVYRVQNGRQVKYGTALDLVLESYSTTQGTLAVVDGVLYARDTCCWYVVEARETFYQGQWQEVCKYFGLNYTNGVTNADYFTGEKQYSRKQSAIENYWAGLMETETETEE